MTVVVPLTGQNECEERSVSKEENDSPMNLLKDRVIVLQKTQYLYSRHDT